MVAAVPPPQEDESMLSDSEQDSEAAWQQAPSARLVVAEGEEEALPGTHRAGEAATGPMCKCSDR